jgi:hypothetical protein
VNTAKKLSATTGLQLNKVTRLLHLADSPEVVQQGVRDGLASDTDGRKSGGAAEQYLRFISASAPINSLGISMRATRPTGAATAKPTHYLVVHNHSAGLHSLYDIGTTIATIKQDGF